MRPTFLLNLELRLVNAIISDSQPHTLRPGAELTLVTSYDTPWGTIPAGAKGFVEFLDERDGMLEVLMEGNLPALFNWNNRLVLVPFDTDDLADRMVCLIQSLKIHA